MCHHLYPLSNLHCCPQYSYIMYFTKLKKIFFFFNIQELVPVAFQNKLVSYSSSQTTQLHSVIKLTLHVGLKIVNALSSSRGKCSSLEGCARSQRGWG